MSINFLNGLNEQDFREKYWEKKPFVFRNIIENPELCINSDDIIEMACDEFYESRLIGKESGNWTVKHGPLDPQDFEDTTKHWTLINHDLNLYLENVFNLASHLDFLPSWLFDDAMSTFSTKGSSVGAHIDNYNVFIVQLSGQRKWEIQYEPNKEFVPGLEVKLLKEFVPDETFILNPGDMIYIPPHIAHHGISESQSLSLSLGYKSLEDKKLMDLFCVEVLNKFDSESFYKTNLKKDFNDDLIISNDTIDELHKRVLKNISNKDFFKQSLLKFTSSTKKQPEEIEISKDEFLDLFQQKVLFKDEHARFSAIRRDKDFLISVNENIFNVSEQQYKLLKLLSKISPQEPIEQHDVQEILDIIYSLVKSGIFYFED